MATQDALTELLTNDNVNVHTLVCDLVEVVKSAKLDQLKQLIVKFDDHESFDFLEDFIVDGGHNEMDADEYWEFIESKGL